MSRNKSILPAWTSLLFACGFLFVASAASGQVTGARQFLDFSLEELLEVEVSSITGRTQKLPESAAAIYVLTADDIAKSSALTIPDLLRTIPGLQVAQIDSNKWAVSARGFNSRVASNLLVIIDGRNIYSPTFATVFWETEDYDLADIERIEVIRGPGATIWGANAVNGVVSITTKSSRNTEGARISAIKGSQNTQVVSGRVGGRVGLDTSYRIYGKYREQSEFENKLGAPVGDYFHMNRLGFRVDSQLTPNDGVVVQGGVYQQNIGQNMGAVYEIGYVIPPRRASIEQDGLFIQGNWTRDLSENVIFKAQVYYDQHSIKNAVAFEDYDTFDFDLRWLLENFGKHSLTLGAGARFVEHKYQSNAFFYLTPETENLRLFNVSVHDDWHITDKMILGFSLKLEENIYTGLEYQPNLSINYALTEKQHVWLATTRAIRTPSRGERSVQFVAGLLPAFSYPGIYFDTYLQAQPSEPAMDVEKLNSIEAGWRYQGAHFNLDFTLFSNKYEDLRSVAVGNLECAPVSFCLPPVDYAVLPLFIENGDSADSEGAELLFSYAVSSALDVELAYTYFDIDYYNSSPVFISAPSSFNPDRDGPLTKLTAEINWQPDSTSQVNLVYRQVSDPGLHDVEDYAVVDFVVKKTFQKNWSLHAGARNLFDRHEEFIDDMVNSPVAEFGEFWYLELVKNW